MPYNYYIYIIPPCQKIECPKSDENFQHRLSKSDDEPDLQHHRHVKKIIHQQRSGKKFHHKNFMTTPTFHIPTTRDHVKKIIHQQKSDEKINHKSSMTAN